MNKLPFNLVKKDENTSIGTIDIIGVIGKDFWGEGVSSEDIKNDLDQIKSQKMTKLIVNINSLGGSVFDAFSIYDMLMDLDIPVIVKIQGFTASAATIIAMSGDEIQIGENSFFLIHKASMLSMGNANEMESDVDFLKKLDDRIMNIYSKRVDSQTVLNLLNEQNGNGIWLSSEQALEFGFVDSITKKEKKEKKEELVYNMVQGNELGLPEPIGLIDTPQNKGFIEKMKDKLFGTKDEVVETPDVETITEEEVQTIVNDIQVDEQIEEVVETQTEVVEEPVLSLVEENDLRITNLEKQVLQLISDINEVKNKYQEVIDENKKLTEDKGVMTEVVSDLLEEKVILEQQVEDLGDLPISEPINLSPEGDIKQKKQESLMDKRINAWKNISDAKEAYRKK